MSVYKPITTCPQGWYKFFLVRPKGIEGRHGGNYLPTCVHFVEGDFYTPDNEIKPVYFGQREPKDSPLYRELEWCELPE